MAKKVSKGKKIALIAFVCLAIVGIIVAVVLLTKEPSQAEKDLKCQNCVMNNCKPEYDSVVAEFNGGTGSNGLGLLDFSKCVCKHCKDSYCFKDDKDAVESCSILDTLTESDVNASMSMYKNVKNII